MRGTHHPPVSVTGPVISLASVLGAAAGWLVVFGLAPDWSDASCAVFLIACLALPCAAAEFFLRQRQPDCGFDFAKPRPSQHRILRKTLGLWAIIAVLLLGYGLLPLYRAGLYQPFHWLLGNFLIPYLILSVPYLALVDAFQAEPEDTLYRLGDRIFTPAGPLTQSEINYLLGWVVKGFFLPLMFSYLCGQIDHIRGMDMATLSFATLEDGARSIYDAAYAHIFFLDVLVAAAGYMMTLRLLGTEIRSVEPTVGGWLVAMACYEPFWFGLYSNFFTYTHPYSWGAWLSGSPILYTAWAAAILFVLAVYGWAAASFGIRFSNLTHRGIITSGPYRWTKHPAYIGKNISWWLISIPFLPADHSPWTALQMCLGLAGVNAIYYLRAKTEERHLSHDPVYRDYAAYIAEHGLFSRLQSWPGHRAKTRKDRLLGGPLS